MRHVRMRLAGSALRRRVDGVLRLPDADETTVLLDFHDQRQRMPFPGQSWATISGLIVEAGAPNWNNSQGLRYSLSPTRPGSRTLSANKLARSRRSVHSFRERTRGQLRWPKQCSHQTRCPGMTT